MGYCSCRPSRSCESPKNSSRSFQDGQRHDSTPFVTIADPYAIPVFAECPSRSSTVTPKTAENNRGGDFPLQMSLNILLAIYHSPATRSKSEARIRGLIRGFAVLGNQCPQWERKIATISHRSKHHRSNAGSSNSVRAHRVNNSKLLWDRSVRLACAGFRDPWRQLPVSR